MADVRLIHSSTGSTVVVPEEKAAGLKVMGYEPEKTKPAAKKSNK